MNKGGLEIERKFLIRYPEPGFLIERCESSDIVQTYLSGGDRAGSERVRARSRGGITVYTHTVKTHITGITRAEDEREISAGEYAELLKRADPERRPVEKTRYCLDYKGQLFEIDVYPFWRDRAVMEIELESEEQPVELPPCISVLREVTGEKRYTNSSMARRIPEEDIG